MSVKGRHLLLWFLVLTAYMFTDNYRFNVYDLLQSVHRLISSALTHLYLKYFDLMPKLEFVAVGEQNLHAM